VMGGPDVSVWIGKSAPTRTTGEDHSHVVMKTSGGGHVSIQVSQTSWVAVAEAGTGNYQEWVVVAG
jgi:hypothetical protein